MNDKGNGFFAEVITDITNCQLGSAIGLSDYEFCVWVRLFIWDFYIGYSFKRCGGY